MRKLALFPCTTAVPTNLGQPCTQVWFSVFQVHVKVGNITRVKSPYKLNRLSRTWASFRMQRYEVMMTRFWPTTPLVIRDFYCVGSLCFRKFPTHLNRSNSPCLSKNHEPTQPDPGSTLTLSVQRLSE